MRKVPFILLYLASSLHGAMFSWNGSISSAMDTPANWTPNGIPGTGDNLTFPASATTFSVNNNIPGNLEPLIVTFNNAYTLTGNPFIVASNDSTTITFGTGSTGTNINLSSYIINGTLVLTNNSAGGNTLTSNLTGSASGNLQLTAGLVNLAGTNTPYLGTTTLNAGSGIILRAQSTSAFSPSSFYSIGTGATLDLNGNSSSVGNVGGNLGSFLTLGTGTLTITNGTQGIPFYGQISGTGNVIVTTATPSLLGPNSYSGTTTIENGATLNVTTLGSTSSLIYAAGGGDLEFGSATSSTATIQANAPAIIGTDTFNVSMSGAISGTSTLSKQGLGTLTLTGANNLMSPGSLQLEGGTLNLNSTSLGTVPITFTAIGSTLQAGSNLTIAQSITLSASASIDANGHTVAANGTIIGGSTLTVASSLPNGTVTLGSVGNTFTGNLIVQSGTAIATPTTYPPSANTAQLVLSGGTFQTNGAYNPLSNNVVLMGVGGTVNTNGNNSTFAGIVAGSPGNSFLSINPAAFTKTGMGTLTLSGANLYTGATIVNQGTLQAGIDSASSSGPFGVGSAVTVASGATLDLNSHNVSIGSLAGAGNVTLETATITLTDGIGTTFSGNMTGTANTAGFTITSGTQTLSGTNNYTGPTNVSNATLIAGSNSAFGSGSVVTLTNGTLNINGETISVGALSGDANSSILLGAGTLTISQGNSQSFLGTMSGTGGAFTLGGGIYTLGGHSSNTGNTTVSASATLNAGSTTAFSPSSTFNVAGVLNLANFSNTVNNITGAGSVHLGNATLTIANGSGTFSGNISGIGGSLVLTNGSLTLSGNNNYTGNTTVNGGALTAGSTTAFGNGANATVNNGTLAFSTFANTVGNLTVNSGAISTSATVTATSFSQDANGTLSLNFPTNMATPYGNLQTSGAISLGGTLTVTNTGGYAPMMGTEITLLHSSGSGKQVSGTFATTSFPFANSTLTYSNNSVVLEIAGSSCSGNWVSMSSGNWDTAASWSTGCAPGTTNMATTEDFALFSNVTGATSTTLTLANAAGNAPQNITLHKLEFGNSSGSTTTNYTIAPFTTSNITLDSKPTGSVPKIVVYGGSHIINAPIILSPTGNAQSASFLLSAGTLTLGPSSSITSTSPTLNLFEGATGSGGTLINQGTISPPSLSIQGSTLNNTGTINLTGAFALSGVVGNLGSATLNNSSGTATVTAASITIGGGAGATVLTNAGTMTSNSTANIGGGSSPLTLTNQGTFTSISDCTIFTGTVENSGSFRSNANLLIEGGTVTNEGTMSGSTSLAISGGTVTNNSHATLGTTAANFVLNNATLINSGAVNSNNFTQNGGANLQMNVLSTANSGSVFSAGTASLNGTLTVNALSGFSLQDGQSLTLISAPDNVVGTFSNVNFLNFPNNLIPNLIYQPGAVLLSINATVPVTLDASTKVVFTSINQHNSFISRKCFNMKRRISSKNVQVAAAEKEFDKESLVAESEEITNFFTTRKTQQLSKRATIPPKTPWNVYGGPLATFGHVKSKGTSIGMGYHSVGGLVGFDYMMQEASSLPFWPGIGAILEYRKKNATFLDHFGSASIDKVHGSVYGTVVPKPIPELSLNGIVGFAYTWDKTKRNVGFNLASQAIGKTNEAIFDLLIDAEYTFSSTRFPVLPKNLSITPLFDIQYIIDWIGGYTERGGGIYDLTVSSQKPQSLSSILGFRLDYLFVRPYYNIQFEFDAGWQYAYINSSATVGFTAFGVTSSPTILSTVAPGPSSLLLGMDILATIGDGWQVEGTANYQYNNLFYDTFFYLGFGRVF